MIKNERQYKITRTQAEKFASALAEIEARDRSDSLSQLEAAALQNQLAELEEQLTEYDALRSGERGVITVASFDELPNALVKARIAMGLSQRQLADKLGMKEQQVQRYESSNYQSASMSRLQEVVDALQVKVREELFLRPAQRNVSALFDRLQSAGVDSKLLTTRILSPAIADRLTAKSNPPSETEISQTATTVGRVFGWTNDELFGNQPLDLKTAASGLARFKIPGGADQKKVSAYTVYAHYLALLVIQATPNLAPKTIPEDADSFRFDVMESYGEFTFENVIRYAWDLGVPVLPLNDSGAFHGAFWRHAGRNIVVLKQRTMSVARWLNDCLHELYHASQEPGEPERSVIEASETSAERRDSDEEREATSFAGDAALDGRAEELAQMCVQAAGGQVERLKAAVPMVAANEDVNVGSLANYMAFRLSLQDVNWWGTATVLQSGGESPWELARDWLIPRLDLDRLSDPDREILLRALENQEI